MLVTHGIHWLPLVDEILVVSQGQITESGTYHQLLRRNGDFAQFLKTYFTQDNDNNEEEDENDENTDPDGGY